ncbi:fasciclin domain-containing protein [Sphingomonas immobilis]|uniref:Fasciclin domain-containing protein n=1 Tax=Sphingomonas immobilis TaxID=3063997 RepID=A0ABT8ZXS2_9SPHN|nr:fasciclin domain-containing protein [Sphingomonas sp. CA1-15]MDO7842369.1 fasciclin domain-containing protein [Sphingomonas sp. CA1-15]
MTRNSKLSLLALGSALAIAASANAQTAPAPAAPTPAAPAPTAPAPAAPGAHAGHAPAAPAAQAPAAPGAPAAPAAPGAPAAPAAPNPTVGGAAMDAAKPIPVNAAAAPNLSTLVKAVTAAGLVPTLSGPGPFTVFAPTDAAFARLAPGTVDTLMKPASKPTLVKVLTYHVVPGIITVAQLAEQAKASGGVVTLTTVEGEPLKVTVGTNTVEIADVNGNKAYLETPDVRQSNGIVHVINGVLLPNLNAAPAPAAAPAAPK